MPNVLVLFRQCMLCAIALALLNAGRSIPAKIAMIEITISNSINVKTPLDCLISFLLILFVCVFAFILIFCFSPYERIKISGISILRSGAVFFKCCSSHETCSSSMTSEVLIGNMENRPARVLFMP